MHFTSYQIEDKKENAGKKSLAGLAVNGGLWLLLLKIVNKGLGFVKTIILARLLAPDDFGLFGIALVSINCLESFSATGINAALIQKKTSIKNYLNSAWTCNVLRSLILFLILNLLASPIAHFFNSPDAVHVLRALSFFQLFSGVENIGILYFQKELQFKKLFYLKLSGILASLTVSISLALIFRNVWALVYGTLAGVVVKTIVSFIIHSYRPKFCFDGNKIKELLMFGKWLFGSSILVFLITEGDDVFVGRVLGVTALAFYQMAYVISNLVATEISNFVAQITFPVYSQIQNNIPRLREAYLKVFQLVSFISFPLSGMIFLLAPEFTNIFLGKNWMPMVPAMQVLSFWGLIRAIGTTTTQVFYAVGKPSLSTKVKFSQLLLIICLIYPLTTQWGLLGASLAIVIATLIPNLAACYLATKVIDGNVHDLIKTLLIPALNTLVLLAVIFITKNLWLGNAALAVHIVIGVFVYIAATSICDYFFGYDLWMILKKIHKEIAH